MQVAFAKDEHPVGADGAYEAFGDGVHPRGLRRGEQGFDADGGEDGVERGGEFGVAVTDESGETVPRVLQATQGADDAQ
ncbi:hypothetical protein KGQ19_08640 [Catenulispora sp. NL8]|uniref:Uncharacterized protein n=1 Tax=Catenulispora pinistramenti TaxID=2705254 RepID=A0ABS5KLM7_9ACTN|nr:MULTISPECIES: hypothetical protein [Catenulispora]MBS2546936.1 hypothetical protein [Catenulispora pinistramenti]